MKLTYTIKLRAQKYIRILRIFPKKLNIESFFNIMGSP